MNDNSLGHHSPTSTFVDLLASRAVGKFANCGFTFFRGDDLADEWLRYSELDQAAQRIAEALKFVAANSSQGEISKSRPEFPPRAIVLCPPGPSYVKAFFGTLYAGMLVVTAYPPRARHRDERLDRVVIDSGATIAIVDKTVFDRRDQIIKATPRLATLQWVNVDDLEAYPNQCWTRPEITADSLAVLQYTSGSTSNPKGVCISHRNLITNSRMIYDAFGFNQHKDEWSVSWLPPYHDMGLIGGLLQPIFAGISTHILPPAAFVQKPIRWLRAIAQYNAWVSGGPNFAFDACVDRISAADRSTIDLSSWKLAFVGAEPIRKKTLDRFVEAFESVGFKRTTFFPCYGLAEATLLVSGGPANVGPKVICNLSNVINSNSRSAIVSCGRIADGQTVRVIDPQALTPLPPRTIGEIWVAGDNISRGYWGQLDGNCLAFNQPLSGESQSFLRTGDLGFFDEDELYITGRLKELIVIRGRNFQPSEIEAVVAACGSMLVPNACAAFETELGAEIGLVIVQEVDRGGEADLTEVVARIRQVIVETFELELHQIVFIAKRTLPKTSSGKVKRLETKHRFEQGLLDELPGTHFRMTSIVAAPKAQLKNTFADVSHWLVRRIAKQLNVDQSTIDSTRPFVQYGLDSVSAVQIVAELELHVGFELPATLFYDAPTIAAVAERIAPAEQNSMVVVDAASGRAKHDSDRKQQIAIVGVACRLPGSEGIEAFWELLQSGRTAITEPPIERRDCVSQTAKTTRAGWISDPALFDAGLFNISPREARCIDPQHRIVLETCWRAIEDAGLDPRRLAGTKTGAFVGLSNRDYERLFLLEQGELSAYTLTGNAASMAAHRLSYHFDLHGPSLAIDTACSSSLVAVHQAVRAIQTGDCDSALVAGVNLIFSPEVSEALSGAEMLSPDGLCKTFDAAANGYVRGEGCVAILLKPLEDALRDGDRVRAVIRGTAINQDGLTNGITAPNGISQARLYRAALADASMRSDDISLLEAHGTGTVLGDPIEVHSLNEVYGLKSSRNPVCHLGAVKANVGHLEAAAGLTSLLKVILELQHRKTVPQPNLKSLNPHFDLRQSRITIPTRPLSWNAAERRIAAVSSFGFGGTNAHLIISESLPVKKESNECRLSGLQNAGPGLIALSASSSDALKLIALEHLQLIDSLPNSDLMALAAATQRQKTSHRHRVAIVAESMTTLRNQLKQLVTDPVAAIQNTQTIRTGVAPSDRKPSICFMFSGQGGQHIGMGRGLYSRSPVFRNLVDQCDVLLQDEFGYRIRDLIVSDPSTNGAVAKLLQGPGSQTSLFVLQFALAKTLMSWGIHSNVVMGHSMGEYAAAAVADVMDWKDALRLTASRAKGIAELATNGAMTVVFASVESVQRQLRSMNGDLSIAAIDGPEHVVVSGPTGSIHALEQAFNATGTATRSLRINHAFHSRLIDPALPKIRETVSRFALRQPCQTYVSTLTGKVATESLQTAEYWMRHSREPVQFVTALESIGSQNCDVAIEIGPHPSLCMLGQLNHNIPLNYRPTLVRGHDDWQSMMEMLADLFTKGVDIDWRHVDPHNANGARVSLPGYPFERKRYWMFDSRVPQPKEPVGKVVQRMVEDRSSVATSKNQVAAIEVQNELSRYSEAMKRIDLLISGFMQLALYELAKEPRIGDRIIPDKMVAQGIVAPAQRRLLLRICSILEEDGVLHREPVRRLGSSAIASETWLVAMDFALQSSSLLQSVASIKAEFSMAGDELRLVSRCGSSLAEILRGNVEPLTLLFPDGDVSDLERLYRDSPIAKCSNRLVANAVRSIVQQRKISADQPSSRCRVLEIGAGTGGTTSFVLPEIRHMIESYTFTDASPLFVSNARSRFDTNHRIDFQVLDIESPVSTQGFEPGSYDVVIAANVLHATKELRIALQNVHELLRPGGSLVALEGVRPERFLDLVFGVTAGWWRFEDTDLRPQYPLIDEQQWTALLQSCDYAEPVALKFPVGEEAAQRRQAVFVAGIAESNASTTHSCQLRNSSVKKPVEVLGRASVSNAAKWIEMFHDHSLHSKASAVEGYFRQTVAAILGHRPDDLDLDQPVNLLGIDSLMAIQLKNSLKQDLGLSVPMVVFLQGKTVRQIIELATRTPDPESIRPSERQPTSDHRAIQPLALPSTGKFDLSTQPLDAVTEQVLGPLSSGQLALWMIHQRAPHGPAYNFAFAARTSGSIDIHSLKKTCQILLKRHPALRTRYRMQAEQVVRVLTDSSDVVISEMHCLDWKESQVLEWIKQLADLPFDLEHGPIIRFSVFRCKSGDVISIAMHHIAADLWSMDVMIQELVELYALIDGGGSIDLGPLTTTYDAYVESEQELDRSEEGARLWAFWRSKLEGAPHTLALPTTYSRRPEQTYNGQSIEWTMESEAVNALRELAHAERTTLFTIVLSAYQAFLARVCCQDDLLVGTVSATRGHADWEGVVGYFLNHLVLRSRFDGSPSFRDLLRDTQREVLDALDNQAFPFAKLVERLRPVRDPSRSPLVQTMFVWDKPRHLQGAHFSSGKSGDRLRLRPILMEQRGAPFDLTLIVFELESDLKLTFRYNTDLFSRELIESLAESFTTFIDAIVREPDVVLRSLSILPPNQAALIDKWNSTDVEFDSRLAGHGMFQHWVERTPDAIAIVTAEESLTYAEVDCRARRLAHALQLRSVGPGDTVGLLLERGSDSIVAILASWKVGAAYVPLDIDHPSLRLQAICDDASPRVLLIAGHDETHRSLTEKYNTIDITDCDGRSTLPISNLCQQEFNPDWPAYIIYTSGSTGTPKGVVVPHRGIANLAVAQRQCFNVIADDRCLQFASLNFDASVFEIVMAFHAGAALCVFDSSVIRSTISEIAAQIRRLGITIATLPPSVLAALPASDLPELHTVISAGEACSGALVQKWALARRMFNAYGPTESTVWATIQRCLPSETDPPVGRPIANVRTYIVDQSLMPLPIGVPGELCVSGPCLATEYKNKPDLTSEAFVPNPFNDRFDGTMYRTGDRAKWNHHGALEYIGRIDDQVKLDGHRIEPGEIAAVIRQMPGIENAFAFVSGTESGPSLLAYFVNERTSDQLTAPPTAADLRSYLATRLPCYMIPKHLIAIEHLPLTLNGKVDTRLLPLPTVGEMSTGGARTSPRNKTESALAEIWQEVLRSNDVGIHDNFFEMGGASMQALLVADLATRRGIAISAEQMFQFQTIAELAAQIEPALKSDELPSLVVDMHICGQGRHSDVGLVAVNGHQNQQMVSTVCNIQPAAAVKELRMVVESIGTYLPPTTLSTTEVIEGCRNRLDFPLQKMTGIATRHVAGIKEFSIDLARHAALECLHHSRFAPTDIDLLIACNISRYDEPNFGVSFEPTTASKLKSQIGASNAIAFDVCNACAGFFTALSIAEARLLSGETRRAMIVSGEYITHLTKTAQLEIDGFLDPRLACLTLGDAGAAVIVELNDEGFGFETLDLYTAGRHHELCIAKVTDKSHGGAIMLTDALKASAVTLDHSVNHAHRVLKEHEWSPANVGHVIMHQTSTTTLNGAIEELNRHFGMQVCDRESAVNNLLHRGNTASTTHWIAVMDMIRRGRIQSGDKAVFAISGSGQTIGTALYRFDHLPDRINGSAGAISISRDIHIETRKKHGVRIVAAVVDSSVTRKSSSQPRFSDMQVVESAASATDVCLRVADWNPSDVEMLLHAGVYRDEFLSEPAVAAIVAGKLKINDDRPTDPKKRTLAFDITDSECGPLRACSIIATMIQSGKIRRGIVTASEVENNRTPDPLRGVAEIGSAIALERVESNSGVGFGDFYFRSYPDFSDALRVSATVANGRTSLVIHRAADLENRFICCVSDTVSRFLETHQFELIRYDRILVSCPASIQRCQLASALEVSRERLVTSDLEQGDAFTSAIAVLWKRLTASDPIPAGSRWLLVAAGAGIEVACVEYQH